MKSYLIKFFILAGISVFSRIQAQDVPVIPVADSIQAPPPVIYKVNIGYIGQFENEFTSSVSVIKNKELTIIPAGNIINRLQGIVPGFNVMGNGAPGNIADHFIRGFGTFGGSAPLYLVDGVPVNDISILNPDDVATIAVLKDAGASAIYGARAMDGVIVITTKKGKSGLKVGFNMSFGWMQPGKGPREDLLNSQEYGRLQWLVYKNDGYEEYHPIYGLSTNTEPTLPEWAANTDWYGEMTQKAPVQRHELSLQGGSDHSWFYGSFGSYNEEGLLIHTYDRKYYLRFNSEWNFWDDRLSAGENFTIRFQKSNYAQSGENNPFLMGPYRSQSIIPVYMDHFVNGLSHDFAPGDFGGAGIAPRLGNSTNVVADLIRNKDDYNFNCDFLGNSWLTIRLLKGLNFTSNFGGTYSTKYGINYVQNTYERAENTQIDYFSETSGYIRDRIWTNFLQYNQNIGNHRVDVVAGHESIKSGNGRSMSDARSGYFSDDPSFRTLSNGNMVTDASSYFISSVPLKSLFLSTNYILRDRYLITLNIRRDKGPNRFSSSVGSEYYTSVSAAWKIGKEDFFDKLKWMNDMTLRGSYGKTGNISTNWEYCNILDLGLDWSFFGNHFNGNFDWFRKESSDLLIGIHNPQTGGSPEIIYINSGSIKNSGVDFQIGYNNKWNVISIYANLIVSSYINRIYYITNGIDHFDSQATRIGTVSRNQTGHSLGEFFGYKVTGLFQDIPEVTAAPMQNGAEPGFFRYENADQSDHEITPDDRVFIGSPHPDFTMGLNLGLTVSNFDLTTLIYWSQGNEIFNFTRWWTDFWPSFNGQKSKSLLYDSWTEENPKATVPKASNKSNFSTNTQICSYYLEDGSYIRLRSLQLGYSVNNNLLGKVRISSFRIYLQALNLVTFTNYSGMDPEINNPSGIDMGSYPNARQILIGFQINI